MRQFCYVPRRWTRCKEAFVGDFRDMCQTHSHLPNVDSVWSICNLHKNRRISLVRIQYTFEDDTLSSCTKWRTLVWGVNPIMFPATLTFSRVCDVHLAPTIPCLSSSTMPMCLNLDTRRWNSLLVVCICALWVSYCTWLLSHWNFWFIRKYIFTRNIHFLIEYSMTGVKSNVQNTLSPYLNNTVTPGPF